MPIQAPSLVKTMNHIESRAPGVGLITNDPRHEKSVTAELVNLLNLHLPYSQSENRNRNPKRSRHLCRKRNLIPNDGSLRMISCEMVRHLRLRNGNATHRDAASLFY